MTTLIIMFSDFYNMEFHNVAMSFVNILFKIYHNV